MPEEINKPVLRPSFRLSRDELAKLIKDATGQEPKDGFKGLSVTQNPQGFGVITWVDAEAFPETTRVDTKAVTRKNAEKPTDS